MSSSGRYANFIAIGVGVIALVTAVTTFNSKVSAMELATSEVRAIAAANKVAIEEEQKTNARNTSILTQLAAQVDNIYKRGLIVQGKALVLEIGDEPYIELNSRDPNGPTRLAGFDHLHVMNLTHPEMFEAEVAIGPTTFSNATPNYVMNISKAAGELLHARPGDWILIRAMPHFEEN